MHIVHICPSKSDACFIQIGNSAAGISSFFSFFIGEKYLSIDFVVFEGNVIVDDSHDRV